MDVPRTLQAIAGQYLARSVREDREYAGGILVDTSGQFRHSVGRNPAGVDRVTFSVPLPPGYRLVGFWHTHGAPGVLRDAFSADDANLVRSTALPLYLITPAGRLKVLKPKHVERRAATIRGRSLFRTKAYYGAPVGLPDALTALRLPHAT